MALAKAQVSKHLSRRLPYYLTPQEAHALMEAVDNERDRLLLKLLWETGLRISEAVKLRLEDVSRDGMRVLGKGNKERVVFVQQDLISTVLFHSHSSNLSRGALPEGTHRSRCVRLCQPSGHSHPPSLDKGLVDAIDASTTVTSLSLILEAHINPGRA
jgi:integrase